MTRLLVTAAWDARLQLRNGFYYATGIMVLFWIVLLRLLPEHVLRPLMPPLVLGNLIINTYYFVGGLVLLEKREGTLEAQVVTPLRTWEYLAAKVATLALLSLAENLLIVLMRSRLMLFRCISRVRLISILMKSGATSAMD